MLELIAWFEREGRATELDWARMFAEKHWMYLQLRKQLPPEVGEQVYMDMEVKGMDPDFSFRKWYGEKCWQFDKPVPYYFTE